MFVTHIEPAHAPNLHELWTGEMENLADHIMSITNQVYPDGYWHDLALRTEPTGGYLVSIHCQLPGSMMVDAAHQMAERSKHSYAYPCQKFTGLPFIRTFESERSSTWIPRHPLRFHRKCARGVFLTDFGVLT